MLQIYDRIVSSKSMGTLAFLTIILMAALVSLAALDRLRTRILVRAGVQLDIALAPKLLKATFEKPNLLQARQAMQEFDGLRATLSGPAIVALFDAPWLPIYLLICLFVHPWIGALGLLGCVLLPAIAWANERTNRVRLDEAQQIAKLSYLQQDRAIGGAEAVRALGMRTALVSRQVDQREAMLVAQTTASLASGNYVSITKFVRLALQSLALGLGALLAIDHLISPGAIFASSFLIARLLAPIEQIIANWRAIALVGKAYENLDTLIDTQAEAKPRTSLPPPRGALRTDGLAVLSAKRDKAIIQGVTLGIAAGEAIAIIGPSGAGKSTLLRVLSGAIKPDRGEIRIDNADMRDWEGEDLARHVGYLPQAPSLFPGTIADNIARFSRDLSPNRAAVDAAVVAAARRVGAHELILALPDGYDHELDHGDARLSAGQAQRIALARAVFGDPAIMMLDEPNAHLDAEGDAQLLEALSSLKKDGKTILIVSHKMSILPVIDRILLMKDGRPAMFGPRQEVLSKLALPVARAENTA